MDLPDLQEEIKSPDTRESRNSLNGDGRRRLYNKDEKGFKESRSDGKSKDRWHVHKMTEDYVNVVGDLMYPKKLFGPFGYREELGQIPLSRVNTLGYLTNPMRRRHVLEKWNPYEIAVFEASIVLYGKHFHKIHQQIISKSAKEVIEFYYFWKKTSHYKQWKKSFVSDIRDTPSLVEPVSENNEE